MGSSARWRSGPALGSGWSSPTRRCSARFAIACAARALSDRVRLLGSVEHGRLAAFYSAADLFVLGSHHEGSGYALIEALACGCVPVVTDVPPFRRHHGDGSVGALWPVGDAARCAEALARLARADLPAARAAATAHFERG